MFQVVKRAGVLFARLRRCESRSLDAGRRMTLKVLSYALIRIWCRNAWVCTVNWIVFALHHSAAWIGVLHNFQSSEYSYRLRTHTGAIDNEREGIAIRTDDYRRQAGRCVGVGSRSARSG